MQNKFSLKKTDEGRRIDQVVLDLIPNLTRSTSKSLLMAGIILVNSKQVKPNYKAKENDSVTYEDSNIDEFLNKGSHYSIKPIKMQIDVIFEDKDTIVVNKPSGLTTHPVPGHREDTLLNGLMYYQQQNKSEGKFRPVHRLDKDTSGVILFAKSRDAHVFYSEQFEKGLVEKTYLAVVKGDFKNHLKGKQSVTVQNYLVRSSKERKKMIIVDKEEPGAQIAISEIEFVSYWSGLKNGIYSLVKIKPKTGRTHQIRVHLAGLGYPVVGDPFYSNTHFKRLMLHSNILSLKKFDGNKGTFIAKLPFEFKS